MNSKTLFVCLTLSTTTLIGCSTSSSNSHYTHSATADNLVISPTAVAYSPANVTIYPNKQVVKTAYDTITNIKVPLYSSYGIRRQQAQVNQILKERTCTLGGNAAIIATQQDPKYLYAQIIRINPTVASTSTSAIPTGSATT